RLRLSAPPGARRQPMRLEWTRWTAAALLGLVLGCRSQAPPAPSGPNVLHLAALDDVPTLDPAVGYDTASWGFEQMLFDTLVRYSDAGVDLVPDLALSWTIAPDAKTFAFRLRDDARFSTGRAVTSADFGYSIERVLTPATRSKGIEYYREIAGAENFVAGRAQHVSGIETPSADRIIFHL